MNESSNPLVWWILIPLFTAVGLYLVWYARRRKAMFQAFSKKHHLPIRPERREELQKTLDSCFSLKNKNLVRSFDQLSSIIDARPICLFRSVELLDLNPYARSDSTHFPRIAALFSVSENHDEFFILDKSMQAVSKLPGSKNLNPDVSSITKQVAASCNARHPLSVTLARGHGLIYFEPLVTGGETLNDIEILYFISKKMNEKFG